ncbi:MAG: transcription elongation factor GreA [Chloroflexi bacterium]|nr:transcription elongation factor GreA [Chloroflexota bacterium]MBT7080918.1 transcription elongation factor GreA [Chloroflexota bacterium]MBT7289061.1 transcription elongation factor GreA [Chloroflexota bacterium]
MEAKDVFVTPEGLKKIKDELDNLHLHRRNEVAEKIRLAKEAGSTVNNAEYDDAKNEQAFVEGRILTLEGMIKNAKIIEEDTHSDKVRIGSHVIVKNQDGDKEEYALVGSAEASPKDGRISNESPIGKALIGKKVGQVAQVKAPAGTIKLTVVKIN